MPWFLVRRAPMRPIPASCPDRIVRPKPQATLPLSMMALLLLLAGRTLAQSSSSLFLETPQGRIPIPASTGRLGQKDPAALAELTKHLAVVGTDPWGGFQGTGKITYGPKDSTSYDVTLSNMGGGSFRLDAQTDKGEMSLRSHWRIGKMQGGGKISTIPTEAAMFGLFPFEFLRLTHFPRPQTSLLDHGLAMIDGLELHRITYEFAGVGRNPSTKAPETLAIDLYFDLSTHLLAKSVAYVLISDTRTARLLDVVTYADYRKVGTSLIPFRYIETMEGEPYRTLQLSDVQLNPSLPATYFEF